MSIAIKTTGQLVDELVTNAFKTFNTKDPIEFNERYELLRDELNVRFQSEVAGLIHDLAIVSMATWQAQEVVMHEQSDSKVADAGRQAQRLNAQRSRLIREIDRLLGEAGITITTKTYG